MNRIKLVILSVLAVSFVSCTNTLTKRQTLRLDGQWKITKTDGELPTGTFASTVPVPGLVDLAVPILDASGTLYPDGWYWHQRTFELADMDFEKIELKIFKAKYFTKVYINGKFAGENAYCFTPSYFDIKPYLLPAGQTNEIIIGVGCQSQLPDTIPGGNDFEKIKYIPGIYDHVEITLSKKPYINNIQCVPDIVNEQLRVVAEIESGHPDDLQLSYRVTEVVSGKTVASKKFCPKTTKEQDYVKVDFEIDMKGAKLWSPESPFLYELKLSTGADDQQVKFGMRSFRFDPEQKIALLNGKPYYMRGTNICFYRFFEDPDRGVLPWDQQWPVTLHERFKDMHWSVMRYCVGFPPERWYEICDSMGFMLQDEYPYWIGGGQSPKNASQLAEEYRRWMRERWNHPSVVIWDANNESWFEETGEAIRAVRSLDLSNRPWDNGYAPPVAETDVCETHPYPYYHYSSLYDGGGFDPKEYRKDIFGKKGNEEFRYKSFRDAGITIGNPWIINEYGWLWLNRDGSPTTLSEEVYNVLWDSKKLTAGQRFEVWGRRLAELTEYWRAWRNVSGVAGVLHFCGLTSSRPREPRGQTSDNWSDIPNLIWEPSFYKYVKPAFAPVGLMIDTWEKMYSAGEKINIPLVVINDLEQPFNHEIQLSILLGGQVVSTYSKEVSVPPYEILTVTFGVNIPDKAGTYLMRGEYTLNGENVFSLRDIPVD
jgi:hypothetical protein